jgi:isopenicillin N synthase-like dioxygenase
VLPIPVIDLNASPRQLVPAIDEACKQWGFFQIVNHGVDKGLRAKFLAEARLFFSLPDGVKQSVARTRDNPWGYYDRELTKNTRDWKEIFDFGTSQPGDQYASAAQWPVGETVFQQTMVDWFEVCERLSETLLMRISQSLGVNENMLSEYFATHTSFLRLNYYPPCSNPADASTNDDHVEGHLGINRHTDAGALTVLVQDEVEALQVKHEHQWQTVQPESDALIINIGDLFQVWSNDRYQAPEHRVLVYSDRERISAPFFYNPAFSTQCSPLVGDRSRYRTVNWGEFREARALGDYGDYGREVQISDYRTSV